MRYHLDQRLEVSIVDQKLKVYRLNEVRIRGLVLNRIMILYFHYTSINTHRSETVFMELQYMKQHQEIKAVTFYREAILHRATLVDLWEEGALLKTEDGPLPKVCEGKTGEYYLVTKYGKTKCRGIIKKVSQMESAFCWEIEFTEISPFKEDPLRRIIEEIVYSDSGRNGAEARKIYG